VLRRRIDKRFLDDLGAQLPRPRDGSVEVADLKPEHHTVSHGCCIRFDKVGVILFIPSMKLKDQVPARMHPIVCIAVAVFR
jgi:hypothetical protein